ncbi:MAG TPA: hypothetical protein VNZ45_04830 [Bacteroidia bacterium]|nr:hypothetical protein [Bacteroidia bacterium]
MNKKPLLLATFLLSFFIIKAQDEDYVRSPTENIGESQVKKFNLAVSLGPAFPIQAFASTNIKGSMWDFNSPDSTTLRGFAQTGYHFDVSLSYLITSDFGIIFYYGGNSNNFDAGSFSSAIGFPTSNTSGPYYTAEYLVGAFVNLPISERLNFKLSALIGLVTNTYPTLSVNLNDTIMIQRTVSGGAGLGYSFGASLTYSLSENINIALNCSYTGSTINYAGWSETDYITFPSLGVTGSATLDHSAAIGTMQTGIIKPSIGIELKF